MSVILFGGTDLTLRLAQAMLGANLPLVGCVHLGQEFQISYSKNPVQNNRHVSMDAWCNQHSILHEAYQGVDEAIRFTRRLGAKIGLFAGWYHMVPERLRFEFALDALGIHASLLPQLRGGAPLNWAILMGLPETGVSLFQLSSGVDDGFLYAQRKIKLHSRIHIRELIDSSTNLAIEMVTATFPDILSGTLKPFPQNGEPSYSLQRAPMDGFIRWDQTAEQIDRLIRAVAPPYPGAYAFLEDKKIIIIEAEPFQDIKIYGAAGQIAKISECPLPLVVCGDGVLKIQAAIDEQGEDVLGLLLKSSHKRFSGDNRP